MRIPRAACIAAATLLGLAACDEVPLNGPEPTAPATDKTVRTGKVSEGGPQIGLELVTSGLTHPVALAEAPDGTGRLFVVDQIGVIRVVDADGTLDPQPFLDVRDRIAPLMPSYDERGLLGLAFHPQFASNGRFFIYYAAPPRLAGYDNTSTVAEYHVQPGDPDAPPALVGVILQEDQPQFNHEGGTLAFGPDGYLYVSIGDGGGANDIGRATAEEWLAGDHQGHVPDWYTENGVHSAGGNGQDIQENLLGNVLRLDVSTSGMYTIPPDNPFVGREGRDEIWAYGFRNPYRFSFDMGGDHALYVGDAGQVLWEEVSVVTRGGNYGWNVKEGTHCFDPADNMKILPSCPGVDPTTGIPLTDPVIELPHHDNPYVKDHGIVVIVGGYVYRGSELPQLTGRYIFGAFATEHAGPSGQLYLAHPRPRGLWNVNEVRIAGQPGGELGEFVLSFGQDLEGEVYVLTTAEAGPVGTTGKVFRLVRP